MGRPQEFDTAEALRRAMHVFWSKGYEGTSLANILHATGLSKSSLYATFGDKRALFLAAFDAYRKERLHYLDRMLNDGQPARQSIEQFFRQGVAHGVEATSTYGCMTANEAVELGPHDVDVQKLVAADFQDVEDVFAQALARGQADGSIANANDPRKLARFLTVGFQGLQVMARARSERARLDDTVTVMMAALD
jgi:TetR/AcrR family transcriptional regulator, transcriptional repressor for nem operon